MTPGSACVTDGAVTFACSGCGEGTSLVSVTPFGDADITTVGSAGELVEWAGRPTERAWSRSRGGTTLPSRIVLIGRDGSELADLGIGVARDLVAGRRAARVARREGVLVTDEELSPSTLDLGGLSTGMPRGRRMGRGSP